jgi:hypothetical protein
MVSVKPKRLLTKCAKLATKRTNTFTRLIHKAVKRTDETGFCKTFIILLSPQNRITEKFCSPANLELVLLTTNISAEHDVRLRRPVSRTVSLNTYRYSHQF